MLSVVWVFLIVVFYFIVIFFIICGEGVMVVEMCKFECKINYIYVYNVIILVLIFGIYWVGGNRKIIM